MGMMRGAMMGGRRMGMRELIGNRRFWSFNGIAGDMDLPLVSLERGMTAVLMDPSETIEIAFVADNPGRRLLHCHMLEHQAGGMITWLEVA